MNKRILLTAALLSFGLAADIKILQGKKLMDYIKKYDKKHIQKLSATKSIKKENPLNFQRVFCGAGKNRTADTRIFSPLLYHLSYSTIVWDCKGSIIFGFCKKLFNHSFFAVIRLVDCFLKGEVIVVVAEFPEHYAEKTFALCEIGLGGY